MLVRNVRWVGVATEHYAAMVDLLESTMGLQKKFEEPTTVEFATVDGDAIQVMAPGDPYFDFFKEISMRWQAADAANGCRRPPLTTVVNQP
jgi:hypothetical protein